MIRNTAKLREFERSEMARGDISYTDALAIFEGLRREAVSLGGLPRRLMDCDSDRRTHS